jgi:pimeloyl-ACP methyl ester carboxylesterase
MTSWSGFESFDGTELAYCTAGEGPVVLLLHGFAADSELNWVRPHVVDALVAAGRRAVALDSRGHGRSAKPQDPAAYADGAMVKDAQALLDHLGLGEVDVCGYSMGGMNAYGLACRESRVRSAVLGGVGAGLADGSAARRAPRVAEALRAEDASSITDPVGAAFRAFADSTGADLLALSAIQRSSRPRPDDPSSIKVPVLVLAGDKDLLVGSPDELARRVPGASAKVVSGDHLTAVYDPAFRKAIVDFLDGVGRR